MCFFLFLEDAIHSFLCYYHQHFPSALITLKIHLMEDHMTPFLRRWVGVGFGLLGEQGAESIHHLNRFSRGIVASQMKLNSYDAS